MIVRPDGIPIEQLIVRMMSERSWQEHVEQAARLTGWLVYHTYDSRRSAPGFPDLVLVRPPSVIFAELKTERGRLTTDQTEWLLLLGDCPGVECYLWRPSDRDAMLERLSRAAP